MYIAATLSASQPIARDFKIRYFFGFATFGATNHSQKLAWNKTYILEKQASIKNFQSPTIFEQLSRINKWSLHPKY